MKKVKVFAMMAIAALSISSAKAQFAVGADVVSSYVWRGVKQGSTVSGTPNIQPTLTYTAGKFTVGAWGSTSIVANDTKEIDLYATYTISSLFSATITDYQYNLLATPYFNYKKGETGHVFEGTLNYAGTKSFPLSASLNVMFAGKDKKASVVTNPLTSESTVIDGDQAYSSYLELGYPVNDNVKLFMGAALNESQQYYTKGFGIINLGLKASKTLELSSKVNIPVYGIVGFNPYGTYDFIGKSSKNTNTAYFVVGVTL